MPLDPLFAITASLALALLFVASGLEKLGDLRGFRGLLENYRLMPSAFAVPAATAVPFVELALAVWMLAGMFMADGRGLVGAAILLLAYGGAMAINLLRGRTHIDCGCLGFGAVRPTIGWPLVARNMLLAGTALLAGLAPWGSRALGAADWISAMGAVATAALLYLGFEQFGVIRVKKEASRR